MTNNYFTIIGVNGPDQHVFFDERNPLSVSEAHEAALDLRRPYTIGDALTHERIVVYRRPPIQGPWARLGFVGQGEHES